MLSLRVHYYLKLPGDSNLKWALRIIADILLIIKCPFVEPFSSLIFLRISPRTGDSVLLFFSQKVVLLWSRSISSRTNKWLLLTNDFDLSSCLTIIDIIKICFVIDFLLPFFKFQYAWEAMEKSVMLPSELLSYFFLTLLSLSSVSCFSKWLMGSSFCIIPGRVFSLLSAYPESYPPGKYPCPLPYF